MPSKNETLAQLRARKHELEGFHYPSPAAVREHAEIIRKLQAIHEQEQEG